MSGQAGDKTEKPTAKRRKDARKDGQIARTNDVGGWLLVLVATWVLPMTIRSGFARSRTMFTDAGDLVRGAVAGAGDGDLVGFLGDAVMAGTVLMAPMVLLALLIGVGTQVAQIGWAPKKVKADLKKLDVIKGTKGLLGPRVVWEAAKNVLKVGAITVLSIGPVREVWESLVASGRGMGVAATASLIADVTVGYLRDVAVLGLVLAAADYLASKRRIDKQVKMTKQEVKEEHKQSEGDPHVKGQIRARQMSMSRNRMMAQIPSADVVLTNPTHIAVALRYDPAKGAPQVVAKGAGVVADRIRELAGEAGVPIVRDVPLARTLHRFCEVDAYIPAELYEAVARILAFVFTLRARGRAAGTHDSPYADRHRPLTELAAPRRRVGV